MNSFLTAFAISITAAFALGAIAHAAWCDYRSRRDRARRYARGPALRARL